MDKMLKASQGGDIDELKRIIQNYIDELKEKYHDEYPDDESIDETLLDDDVEAFVNSQKPVTNTTAMHLAARGGFLDICEYLLQHNAKLDLTNTDDRTPLHFAAQKGYKDICSLFLDHGAILDPKDRFVLLMYSWSFISH